MFHVTYQENTKNDIPKSRMLTTTIVDKELGQQKPSFTAGGNAKRYKSLWKTVWVFLTKLNVFLMYDPAIMLLGIHPKELKIYIHSKTCTWVFMAALFIIAKI